MYKKMVSRNLTATTTEANLPVSVQKISAIVNRGTNNLHVSFNKTFATATDVLIVDAGTEYKFDNEEDISCGVLYYKTLSGTTDFSYIGFNF